MKLIFMEQDDDYNDWDLNTYDYETYYYTVIYFTYYKDKYNFETPLIELDESVDDNIPMDDDTDPIKYIEKQEVKINEEVINGAFPGLWVHTITIPIESNYEQVDVDRWFGSSKVDVDNISYESTELPMPDNYDEDDYDVEYLADYAENYWRNNI